MAPSRRRPASSQEPDLQTIQNLLSQRQQRTHHRRRARVAALTAAHTARIEALQLEARQHVQAFHAKISALRREKLRALIEAVRKRQALVERIEICQERLARAFGEAARPLGKALEGRVKNLRD